MEKSDRKPGGVPETLTPLWEDLMVEGGRIKDSSMGWFQVFFSLTGVLILVSAGGACSFFFGMSIGGILRSVVSVAVS